MAERRSRLAQRRKALGYSQDAFAEVLGVDRSTVARWERGESEPLPYIRPKLARVLGVTAAELGRLLLPSPTAVVLPSAVAVPPNLSRVPSHRTTSEDDDMNRRELLQLPP